MSANHPSPEAALALLQWYVEMGVDVGLDEIASDRLAPPVPAASPVEARVDEARPRQAAPRTALPAASLLTTHPDAVVLAAREQAMAAQTLDELRDTLDRFEGCALKATATRLAFSDGHAGARLMLVGEAPGREEDVQGRPFVGRSGQLLDRMLAAIGLDRGSVYIANVVPWRPPGNRTPTPQEIAICRPFIERQIELAGPRVLVCLGAPSAQTLLGATEGILRMRGRWMSHQAGGISIRAMATLHPAFLLRQPVQKRLAWRDFRAIRVALETG
jgi:uracil-DNA glycosylase family 4